jgi:hypothetical protein
MTTEHTTKQIIQAGILLMLTALVRRTDCKEDLRKYFTDNSTIEVVKKLSDTIFHWCGDSKGRLQEVMWGDQVAMLEILHIAGEIPLPISELDRNVCSLLSYLSHATVTLEATDAQALAWMANGEIAWCISHYANGKPCIIFNMQEVKTFLKSKEQNVQANDTNPDSPA